MNFFTRSLLFVSLTLIQIIQFPDLSLGQGLEIVHIEGVCAVPNLPKGFERFNYNEMTLEGRERGLRKIGDIKTFFTRKNVLEESGFVSLEAELVAESDLVEIWVDITEWNIRVDQDDADQLVIAFELETPSGSIDPSKGILALGIEYFGSPPDVDGNGKVILLILDINDNYDPETNPSFVSGYFDQADQVSDMHPQTSGNVADILYLDSNPGNKRREEVLSTASHELQHLINFNYDRNEDSWLNEGLSEYASKLAGYQGRGFGKFLSQTNRGLTVWDNLLQDYARTGLWMTYTSLKLGLDAIKQLVQDDAHGVGSAENVIKSFSPGTSFPEFVYEWTIANLLNDTVLSSGEFGYKGIELPSIIPQNQYFQLPIYEVPGSVHSYASSYHEFSGGTDLEIFMDFFGRQDVKATIFTFSATTTVAPVVLDANGVANIELPGFGNEFSRAILMISYMDDALDSVSYFYSASGIGGYEVVELSNDDGETDFFIKSFDTPSVSVASLFNSINTPSSILSVKVFMGSNDPISIQIRDNGINSNFIFEKRNITPAINGWTEINLESSEIVVSAPTAVSITVADSIIIGYDEDSNGIGNAFIRTNNSFIALSNLTFNDGQSINGTWMIRLLLRQDIEIDTTLNSETAIRGDDWIEFEYSDGIVTIPYTVGIEGDVNLYLYDILGRTVQSWGEGQKSPGRQHQVFWNGKNSFGHTASSGIYFIRLMTQDDSAVKKLRFIK